MFQNQLPPPSEQTQVTPKFRRLSTRLHSATSHKISAFEVNEIKDSFTHYTTQNSGPTTPVTQPPVVRAIREKSPIVHRQKIR